MNPLSDEQIAAIEDAAMKIREGLVKLRALRDDLGRSDASRHVAIAITTGEDAVLRLRAAITPEQP